MKERVEQVADARTGVAVELERMILDALGAESGDDDDVLDAIGDERRDLPADEAAAVELDQAFGDVRSEEHTSELQSLMRISYAVFCLKKKTRQTIYLR